MLFISVLEVCRGYLEDVGLQSGNTACWLGGQHLHCVFSEGKLQNFTQNWKKKSKDRC